MMMSGQMANVTILIALLLKEAVLKTIVWMQEFHVCLTNSFLKELLSLDTYSAFLAVATGTVTVLVEWPKHLKKTINQPTQFHSHS